MKVTINTSTKVLPDFESLQVGAMFMFAGKLYVKSTATTAVRVTTTTPGEVCPFNCTTLVSPVAECNVTLHFNG